LETKEPVKQATKNRTLNLNPWFTVKTNQNTQSEIKTNQKRLTAVLVLTQLQNAVQLQLCKTQLELQFS
jgi:hypothetical protein